MRHLYSTNFIKAAVCMLALLFINLTVLAQSGSIQGRVTTSDGQPAGFVNIYLKEISKGTASEENGNFHLKNVKAGSYTLISSLVGLQTLEKTVVVEAGKVTNLDFSLHESGKQLSEVQITTKRSLNERQLSIGNMAARPIDLPQSMTIVRNEVITEKHATKLSYVIKNVTAVSMGIYREITAETLFDRGYNFDVNNYM